MSFGLIWRLYKHKKTKKLGNEKNAKINAKRLGVDNFILLL